MKIHRQAERALIAQLILNLLLIVRSARGSEKEAREYVSLLITGTLLVFQHRGTAANPTAVARSLKIPRSTVLRRLNLLMLAGIVERTDAGRYVLTPTMPGGDAYIDKALHQIKQASRKLSRMDTTT